MSDIKIYELETKHKGTCYININAITYIEETDIIDETSIVHLGDECLLIDRSEFYKLINYLER